MANEHVTFVVDDLGCEACALTVREALLRLNGVVSVMADAGMKRVAVEFDSDRLQTETLRGTIEDTGYKVR